MNVKKDMGKQERVVTRRSECTKECEGAQRIVMEKERAQRKVKRNERAQRIVDE